jgi:hypothetical protein
MKITTDPTPSTPPPPRPWPTPVPAALNFQSRNPIRYKRRAAPPVPPQPPPAPPRVVWVSFMDDRVVFTFDRPVATNAEIPDDALTVNGMTPTSVGNQDATGVFAYFPSVLFGGEPWAIGRQPNWVQTEIGVPEDGSL